VTAISAPAIAQSSQRDSIDGSTGGRSRPQEKHFFYRHLCPMSRRRPRLSSRFPLPIRNSRRTHRTYFLAAWNEKIDARQRNAILIPRVSHFLNLERNRSLRWRHRTFRYVMEAAKGHRLRVPEDIAVVGFDDISAAKRIALQLATPRINPLLKRAPWPARRRSKINGSLALSYLRSLSLASLRPSRFWGRLRKRRFDVR
jgi:hypothetical protein